MGKRNWGRGGEKLRRELGEARGWVERTGMGEGSGGGNIVKGVAWW